MRNHLRNAVPNSYGNNLMIEKVVDVHIHPLLTQISEKQLIKEVKKAGVDFCVLLAVDVDCNILDKEDFKNKILQKCLDLYIWDSLGMLEKVKQVLRIVKTSNQTVASLVEKYPKLFVGFGSVNPSKSSRYVEEKLREIKRLKLRGVKLMPTLQFFNPKKAQKNLTRIFEFCEKEQKIVMYHTGCDPLIWEFPEFSEDANPKYLGSLVRKFREVPVILAHMGCYSARFPGIWLDEALKLGVNQRNVWFDISAVNYVATRRDFVEKVRKSVGWDMVLFGSDYPVLQGENISSSLREVLESKFLTKDEKAKVLGLNAAKLLGLKKKGNTRSNATLFF